MQSLKFRERASVNSIDPRTQLGLNLLTTKLWRAKSTSTERKDRWSTANHVTWYAKHTHLFIADKRFNIEETNKADKKVERNQLDQVMYTIVADVTDSEKI